MHLAMNVGRPSHIIESAKSVGRLSNELTRLLASTGAVVWGAILFLGGVPNAVASEPVYQVGDIVDPEDFKMVNRREWIRDDGHVVRRNDELRLSDLSGKVIFVEWFKWW